MFFLLVGFALVVVIRWQHAYAGQALPLLGGLLGDAMHPAVSSHRSSTTNLAPCTAPACEAGRDSGIVQPVWFTATQLGQWDIACSQLCGLGHFRMKGVYAIQTQAAFDAWLNEEAEFLANP